MEFITDNWSELLLALITLAGTITALTETEADDKWLDVVKRVLNAVVFGKAKK
jgi:hypothetical protein